MKSFKLEIRSHDIKIPYAKKTSNKRGTRIGKRGFTYLIVTSLAIIVILAIFFADSTYNYQDKESLYQYRIRVMNDFVKNLNSDIHRASYIAGYRAMLALEDYVSTSGTYLSDMPDSFKETFYYGTINGTSYNIMVNSSFSDYLSRVQSIASSTGIIVYMNVTNVSLSQSDPWSIDVNITVLATINDTSGVASWVLNNSYVTNIPIYNLRDPLYSKNTLNRVPNTVRIFNATLLVNGTDTTGLLGLINGSYYLASASAPDFVMRFEGNMSPSPYGIESIVDITALSSQDIPVDMNAIKVDYIYFNNISGSKVCNVENVPSSYYFVINASDILTYQISGLNYSTSCP